MPDSGLLMLNLPSQWFGNRLNGFTGLSRLARWWPFAKKPISNETSPVPVLVCDAEMAPDWEDLPGSECVAHWADELRAAISEKFTVQQWRIVGRAGVIESDEEDACKAIFRRAALDAGLGFTTIPGSKVLRLFETIPSSLIPAGPVMVFLEKGEWLETLPGKSTEVDAFREALNKYHATFDPSRPVIFVTSIASLGDICPDLKAAGLLDRRFVLREPSPAEVGRVFLKLLGPDLCVDSVRNNVEKVGYIAQRCANFRVRGLHVLHLQRIAAREKRLLELKDLWCVSIEGTVETTPQKRNEIEHRNTAVHEAGHAVSVMIDSAGRHIPDFLSIRETAEHCGTMISSNHYYHQFLPELTYAKFCEQIRCCLAGRAAEELVLGPCNISAGCGSDLKRANMLALRAFGKLGFEPPVGMATTPGLQLRVTEESTGNSEQDHYLGPVIRQFLEDQYRSVLTNLATHRDFLDAVTEELLRCEMMVQDDIAAVSAPYLQALQAAGPGSDPARPPLHAIVGDSVAA